MSATSGKRVVGPSYRWLEIPALDETRCTGSALCVEVCPSQCLEMTGSVPWLPRPDDCVSCSLCVLVCPSNALKMAKVGES